MPVAVPMDVAPYRLSGRVYGALLNHRAALAALGDSVNQPPYKAPPTSSGALHQAAKYPGR